MENTQSQILYKDESYKIMGACFEVYREKGNGFTEPTYQECLEIEFASQCIPFEAQPEIPMSYKGKPLKSKFRPDFLCFKKIILEIKAVCALTDDHRSQVLNYLHAGGFELGLLVNFGHHPKVQSERIALSAPFRDLSRFSRAPFNS